METVRSIIYNFRITDAIDIAIVSFILYKVISFIRETRAQQLVRGIIVLVAAFLLSSALNLYLLNWLLRSIVTMGIFALVVLFQPELRRGLEQIGRRNLMLNQFRSIDKDNAIAIVNEIVTAIDDFSSSRTGALICFERQTMLNDIIETGAVVDAAISARLLGNLFYEGSPLHDGAVIIRGDRIHAAACVLPLTEKKTIGRNLGTRHRAGVGITEVSDALVLIVSEETGVISIAENGNLRRFVDLKTVEKLLLDVYLTEDESLAEKIGNLFRSRKGGTEDEEE